MTDYYMPIISVIIPVFNGERTIQETVKSVLQQTFDDFELIIINASSTDSTLDVISQFQDSRIKVFSYPKANVAVNRNRGAAYAVGEFLTFIDADDLWTPDKLEAQYKALVEYPEAAVAYSWTNCIDETGKFLRKCSTIAVTGNVYPHLLLEDFIGNGSNVMICYQAFKDVGGFDESLTNAQDSDLWLKLAARYQFVAVPKVQVLYRILTDSMSANVWKLESACLQVLERSFSHAPASLQYLKSYCLANLYKYLLYRSLEGYSDRSKIQITTKFIIYTIKTDPSILFKKTIYKALLKLILIILFTRNINNKIFSKFPSIKNTSSLLGYIITDPHTLPHK
ncbi:glycosyl transferase [Nostoc sp. PCC 7524]|uniref:glycosyltransferase n=1 Tax=Nostoc sp. (strain ATCC 29411 / PCC 7524) TaxID=28072 RepID=UPI00029F0D2A|nr:glycosyltransferase [Nostoc sp. PCC 7524]AFY50941.1 glycosyl transferase [Nostoc sp. PCC 7524]